jgi:cytidylate kinase
MSDTAAVPVIAVDGPGGTGKGTLCQQLAASLGWHLLDSGVLYRLVGLLAPAHGLGWEDEAGLSALAAALPVCFEAAGDRPRILLEGVDVSDRVRAETVGEAASRVAACPGVRAALLHRQRDLRRPPGLVADGRDMGTVVFPDAALKVFLTATPEVRAERRYKQLRGKGIGGSLATLLEDIRTRDERDAQRAIAPLVPAPDAVILDTSHLGIDEVLTRVMQMVQRQGLA